MSPQKVVYSGMMLFWLIGRFYWFCLIFDLRAAKEFRELIMLQISYSRRLRKPRYDLSYLSTATFGILGTALIGTVIGYMVWFVVDNTT